MNNQNYFEIAAWDEAPYLEGENGIKHTRAAIVKNYSGIIAGTGKLEYLMSYHQNGSVYFVGIEKVEGSYNGRKGSFSLTHQGTFNEGVATSEFSVIAHSGTGELATFSGQGKYAAGHAKQIPFEFAGSC